MYLCQSRSCRAARSCGLRPGRAAMKLRNLIADYVAFRQSMGYKFTGSNVRLQTFCRVVGSDIDVEDVTTERVLRFLGRPTSGYWHEQYAVMTVCDLYAVIPGTVN